MYRIETLTEASTISHDYFGCCRELQSGLFAEVGRLISYFEGINDLNKNIIQIISPSSSQIQNLNDDSADGGNSVCPSLTVSRQKHVERRKNRRNIKRDSITTTIITTSANFVSQANTITPVTIENNNSSNNKINKNSNDNGNCEQRTYSQNTSNIDHTTLYSSKSISNESKIYQHVAEVPTTINYNNDKPILTTIINEQHEELIPSNVFPGETNDSEHKSLIDNNLTIRYRTYSDIITCQTLRNTDSRISYHHSDPEISPVDRTFNQRLEHINTWSRCLNNERTTCLRVDNSSENRFYNHRKMNKQLRSPPSYIKELKAYLAHREASVTDVIHIRDMKKISNVLVWLAKQPTPVFQRDQSSRADCTSPFDVSVSPNRIVNALNSTSIGVNSEIIATPLSETVHLHTPDMSERNSILFSAHHSYTLLKNTPRSKTIESTWKIPLRPQQDKFIEKTFGIDNLVEQRQDDSSIEQNIIDNMMNAVQNEQSCSTHHINNPLCLNQQNCIIILNEHERQSSAQSNNKMVNKENDSIIVNEISQYSGSHRLLILFLYFQNYSLPIINLNSFL
ncbi:unnamed protein product [Didymodactylos carnosus]|uniref:Uncharacterized protein n=1 Tax=Didymodactylos carnosus TaxID=1234261 RepID=A0A8S2EE21_9BILA|nr:unnamed protein product [Didymodactylos carnosus]CAF4009953.1 unnamed protein product [Didymodactylos carnosus]